MTRCYSKNQAITLAWPDYMQYFQELLMQKPWLKITSDGLELILVLKGQNFQTTHYNLPKKSVSLGKKEKKKARSSILILLAHFKGKISNS